MFFSSKICVWTVFFCFCFFCRNLWRKSINGWGFKVTPTQTPPPPQPESFVSEMWYYQHPQKVLFFSRSFAENQTRICLVRDFEKTHVPHYDYFNFFYIILWRSKKYFFGWGTSNAPPAPPAPPKKKSVPEMWYN